MLVSLRPLDFEIYRPLPHLVTIVIFTFVRVVAASSFSFAVLSNSTPLQLLYMAPRRLAPSASVPNPQESHNSGPGVSTLFAFPRSNSPSTTITGFLSKPTKWFSRSSSTPRLSGGSESRPVRKQKISSPQDPRPILNTLHADSVGAASRQVIDLRLFKESYPFPRANTTPL